jgi:uncharacterized protein (DUF433 family)
VLPFLQVVQVPPMSLPSPGPVDTGEEQAAIPANSAAPTSPAKATLMWRVSRPAAPPVNARAADPVTHRVASAVAAMATPPARVVKRRDLSYHAKRTMRWQDHITSDPLVGHGKPCIRGTRIFASVVLDNLAGGRTPSEIVADYPSLTLNDIQAAIAYAAELAHERVVPFPGAA